MTSEEGRFARAGQSVLVGGLPDAPGILTALNLTPELGIHLRGLADELLVNDFEGATISRFEREMLAAATSQGNECYFCMDSHAAHGTAVAELLGERGVEPLVKSVVAGQSEGFSPKMQALLRISRIVGRNALELCEEDVRAANDAGASDQDVQLAVLIAAGFSMYNRLVDGFRAQTAPVVEVYKETAERIAQHGYSGPPQN
jgi:uncharacterized peroxidase-related enzyme